MARQWDPYEPVPRRRTSIFALFPLLLFALLVVLFAAYNLLTPDREVSENENRLLKQRPSVTVDTLLDGSFFRDLTDWYSDQFAGRDQWLSLDLLGQDVLGRHESGGVILGADGYLFAKPEAMNEEKIREKTDAVNRFAQAYPDIPMTAVIVPSASTILADRLPDNVPIEDQPAALAAIRSMLDENVRCPDISAVLSPISEEYIYYRTDHHWTSRGAWAVFRSVAEDLGIGEICEYRSYAVTNDFEGTLASKTGSHVSRDMIEIYVPDTEIHYYVNYLDAGEKTRSLYKSECLEEKDKYTVFFGGNFPRIDIITTANNDRCLLVFKDSYANCFMQFLTPYYEKIIMIDPRYYYDDPTLLVSSEKVTDVLLLYSADTFMTDVSLTDVLTAAAGDRPPMTIMEGE